MNNDQMMKDILLSIKTIASVGLSSNTEKESYWIVSYLKDQGYEIFLLAPGSKFTDGYNPLDMISADPNQRITDLQKLTPNAVPAIRAATQILQRVA